MVATRRQSRGAPAVDAQRQPVAEGQKPSLTIGDVKRAIMKESPWVFERSVLKSSAYLVADLMGIAALYYASTFIDTSPLPTPLKWAAWLLYWFFQGAVATGVWVVAHECGHQASKPGGVGGSQAARGAGGGGAAAAAAAVDPPGAAAGPGGVPPGCHGRRPAGGLAARPAPVR